MAKQTAGLVDPRLAKALSHPMRTRILAILNERVASPNEIAEMIDERLPNVSYHVRALLELGCIELVSTAQRRGAIEHYYRALTRPFFSDRDWKRLPRSGRQAVSDLDAPDDLGGRVRRDEERDLRKPLRPTSKPHSAGVGRAGLGRGERAPAPGARAGGNDWREERQASGEVGGTRIPTMLVMMHFERRDS